MEKIHWVKYLDRIIIRPSWYVFSVLTSLITSRRTLLSTVSCPSFQLGHSNTVIPISFDPWNIFNERLSGILHSTKNKILHTMRPRQLYSVRSFDSYAKALVFETRAWQTSVVKAGSDNSTVKSSATGLCVMDIRISPL